MSLTEKQNQELIRIMLKYKLEIEDLPALLPPDINFLGLKELITAIGEAKLKRKLRKDKKKIVCQKKKK